MPLPLPNLDDRRWLDLTQEAIPLIPRYAPQWTDFNTHDPGITLIELFAGLAESMVYRLNQVPDRFRWKFLSLIGYAKRGPEPAWTVLSFQPIPLGTQISLPAGTQFIAPVADGTVLPLSTTRAIDLSEVTLSAIQVDAGDGAFRDYSRDLFDGLPVTAFGATAVPDAAVYFGFDAIPTAIPVAFRIQLEGAGHDTAARARIMSEAVAQKFACKPVAPGWPCNGSAPAPGDSNPCAAQPAQIPPHHSARIVWEIFTNTGWTALNAVAMPARPAAGEVVDNTRSLTLDGLVEVNLPASLARTTPGAVAAPLFYLRCRFTSGAFDTPVVLSSMLPNAVAAVQRTPLLQQLSLSNAIPALATPPTPGAQISLQFTVAVDLTVQSLSVQAPPTAGQPAFPFLNYAAPAGGNNGVLTAEFTVAGIGTAVPSQQVNIPGASVVAECTRLFTHDGVSWTTWQQVADFDSAKRTDFVYTLDPLSGLVTCGDGERGRVFPEDNAIVVTGFTTAADAGNISAGKVRGIASSPVNQVLLAGVSPVNQSLLKAIAANPIEAVEGAPPAPLTELEGEAAEVVHAHERILDLAENAQQTTLDQIPKTAVLALPAPSQAVNLLDTERIALDVSGTAIARARAWADIDPLLPGIHATGVVTVVILPNMPVAEPMPSTGLIAAVKRYLDRRRVICTRMEVAQPTYVVITVTAGVTCDIGASVTAAQAAVVAALDGFLNPLTGGPAGLGWPFGRSVYRAEILQLIAGVPGVDHVNSMTISADSETPQCGDIPVCPTFLVTSGTHQIQVTTS